MTTAQETRRQVHFADRAIRAWATAFHDTMLVPLLQYSLDDAYHHGMLPLPPLGWCRSEVWYVGDLV